MVSSKQIGSRRALPLLEMLAGHPYMVGCQEYTVRTMQVLLSMRIFSQCWGISCEQRMQGYCDQKLGAAVSALHSPSWRLMGSCKWSYDCLM